MARYHDYFLYFLVLQPRRIVWLALLPIAVISPAIYFLPDFHPSLRIFKVLVLTTTYLIVSVAVLFISGHTAWNREREKNQSKWPQLSGEQIELIVKRLKALDPDPYVFVHHNPARDCSDLATQIHDAMKAAGWNIQFASSTRRWSPGLTIAVQTVDQRVLALQNALIDVGIVAQIETNSDISPHVLIGSKIRPQ